MDMTQVKIDTTTAVKEVFLKDVPLFKKGKVREVYDLGQELLIVATDRISAFDFVLSNAIPSKGAILTQISLFWFDYCNDVVANHLISGEVGEYPEVLAPFRSQIEGRSMLVKKTSVIPFECVVRGYLAGSGWKEYSQNRSVCGIPLPEGYVKADRLKESIFTPATKADEGHDENIPFSVMENELGQERARQIRDISFELYQKAADHLLGLGIILADTKFEFGLIDDKIVLIDEIFTPDSSRMWPSDSYVPGEDPVSFDKQYIRDWLLASQWDRTSPPPPLPSDVIAKTVEKYGTIYKILIG